MAQITDNPIPQINKELCDGCELCVRACQNKAIGMQDGKAVVVDSQVCEYCGLCEMVCPRQAISRLFEIVIVTPEDGKADRKSTKVVEKD